MSNAAHIKFIETHKNDALVDVALLLSKQPTFDRNFILSQINGLQKVKTKLPQFYITPNIVYPTKLSLEQSSSEKTGVYKSKLVPANTLVDLTGGFGIDSFYFSKTHQRITYVEQNPDLYGIVKQNFKELKAKNIHLLNTTAELFAKNNTQRFGVAYIDPSRRDENKRVFKLAECTPNIIELAPKLFQFSDKILVKTSPLLDIKQTLRDLRNVSKIWVVSVNNDCKEVLYLLEETVVSEPEINTVNLTKNNQEFSFSYSQEGAANVVFSEPERFLYEPNASLLKAGAFNSVCKAHQIKKIAPNTHLYTSEKWIENFPGRCFRIDEVIPYSLKKFKLLKLTKANLNCRNFKHTVSQTKQKLNLKDGGETYLFATTNLNNKPILMRCNKVST